MVATIGQFEGRRATTGLVGRVDLVEGEFDLICEICGELPAVTVVRVWEEDPAAPQKVGEAGPVERHPFCAIDRAVGRNALRPRYGDLGPALERTAVARLRASGRAFP
jgi:hypothetical protein